MAISLGGPIEFKAYCGFAPKDLIRKNLLENRVLAEILGYEG